LLQSAPQPSEPPAKKPGLGPFATLAFVGLLTGAAATLALLSLRPLAFGILWFFLMAVVELGVTRYRSGR
jgi:hypothetical protein